MPIPPLTRSRWAALGAAVAVSFGAGGVGLLAATSPEGAAAFVPITPCRLFDTRPAPDTVGERTSPLGPDETYTVSGRGDAGECALPDTASGLVLNVTAVGATQATFLTLFPSGAERPTASHLNPSPGAPPAPNAVTVDLSPTGQFSVFNRFGSVHVIADAVGYYTDHHHDDRYYTKAQASAALDTRVPLADSTALAGGAFTPREASLVQAPGSACFRPEPEENGMRHAVPVTAGSTVTAIAVRAHNTSVYTQQFNVTLWAQRPGSTDGVSVHSQTFTFAPEQGLLEARTELPAPELVDPGEALYLSFTPSASGFLCAAEVEFSRPG